MSDVGFSSDMNGSYHSTVAVSPSHDRRSCQCSSRRRTWPIGRILSGLREGGSVLYSECQSLKVRVFHMVRIRSLSEFGVTGWVYHWVQMVFVCSLIEYIVHVCISWNEKVIKEFLVFLYGALALQAWCITNTRVGIVGIICIIIIYSKPGGGITTSTPFEL